MRIKHLLLLILLASLASADTGIGLSKGWNLVSVPGEGELSMGTCTINPVGMVYVSYLGRFLRISEVSKSMDTQFGVFLASHSFWAYSYQDCELGFEERTKTKYTDIWIEEGWTFVPVTEDMIGMTWKEISGGCKGETIYTWNRGWEKLKSVSKIKPDMLGKGLLVKSGESCRLG